MASKSLKIDKSLRPSRLWAYTDGQVWASIFSHPEANQHIGKEPEGISSRDTTCPDSITHEPNESRTDALTGDLKFQDTSIDKIYLFSHQTTMPGNPVKRGTKRISRSCGNANLNKSARPLLKLQGDGKVTHLLTKSSVIQALPEEKFFLIPK